jgi:hypothetical protein
MKKKKQDYKKVYVNVDHEPLFDTKPTRELRPKCVNCDNTILMRKSYWYVGSRGYKDSPPKYYYDGIGYFCCRNCAQQYGIEAARKALGHPEFNIVK